MSSPEEKRFFSSSAIQTQDNGSSFLPLVEVQSDPHCCWEGKRKGEGSTAPLPQAVLPGWLLAMKCSNHRARERSWIGKGQVVTVRAGIYWRLPRCQTPFSAVCLHELMSCRGHYKYHHFAEKEKWDLQASVGKRRARIQTQASGLWGPLLLKVWSGDWGHPMTS